MEDRRSIRGFLFGLAIVLVASELVINSRVDASSSSSSWWSLGLYGCDVEDKQRDQCRNCASMRNANFLNDDQNEQCVKDSSTVKAVARGTRHAILDCQRRFNDSKWNCSTFESQNIFGSFIENNTRETALVHGYILAGSMWALAEECAQQRIVNCPCQTKTPTEGDNPNGDIVFYSCDANVDFAVTFLDTFASLGTKKVSSDIGARLNYKNSIAGMNIMKKRFEKCRCHGISGTCTARTCFNAVMSVEDAGETLVELYRNATQVEEGESVDIPTDTSTITDLEYKNPSPDFCSPNEDIGVIGVEGRPCELNHPTRNCTSLCCNRGFETINVEVPVETCRFIFCCRLECVSEGTRFESHTRCK